MPTVSASGNYTIGIDSDNDGANNVFIVDHDVAESSAKQLFALDEGGNIDLAPAAGASSPFDLRRVGDVVLTC